MNKNFATECVLDELAKFENRCKRNMELDNKGDSNKNPQISDIIEYFINLNYSKIFGEFTFNEETIYKTYSRANDGSVNICFNGVIEKDSEQPEFPFAGLTINNDKVIIKLTGFCGSSQIILDRNKVENNLDYSNKEENFIDEYKCAYLNQKDEPYYYEFRKTINGSRIYEAGLESMLTEFEDRAMFTFHSADNLKPYSILKGNIVGAIYGSNKVNTTENIFVTLKKETELRIEANKKKQAKRTRKNLK